MPKGTRIAVTLMIVAFGLVPPALYWYFLGRVPTVSPAEARAQLAGETPPLLVDLRTAEEYSREHVAGAVNWPYGSVLKSASPNDVPESLRGRKLFLLCGGGVGGAFVARHLAETGVGDVYNVRGGMDEWIATLARRCVLFGFYKTALPADTQSPFYRESPRFEQWATVLTGFVVKPFYMLLALVLALLLRRRREADLAALKWGLLFFFVGEAFCALNYTIFEDGSYLFEYLHGYPMALAFGFTTFAFFEGLDRRIVKYSSADEKCAAFALCPSCAKYADAPCTLRRLFLLVIPASLVLAFMPLSGEIHSGSYNTSIFGTLYNYSHPAVYQIFEMRYCPLAAILLFAVSLAALVFLRRNAVEWSKVFFAAGSGALGFSILRWVLFSSYWGNLVWASTWEEITELLYVAGVAYVLWLFRYGLFRKPAETRPSDE